MCRTRFFLVISLLLTMAASQSAWAQQYARPDGVQSTGTWTAVNAASHAAAVNEDPFDNADYINSGIGNNSTIIFTLSDISDPGAGNYANSHIIRYRCQSTLEPGAKGKQGEGCDATLYLLGTPISGTPNTSATRGSFGLVEYTIVDASALQGANYANLELHITSSGLDVDESVQVSWVELEVAGASTSAPLVTTIAAAGVTNNQATLGGNVSSNGGDALTGVGVYYSTTDGFTPPGQGTQLPMTIQPVPGDFTGDLTGLPAGTTYYYRAYATNSIGETIAAPPQEQFTTKDFPVMLATPTVTVDSPTSATLGGTMTSNGFDPTGVSDCGIEWGTLSGGPYTQVSAGVCTENNAFFVPQLIDLTTGQDYYLRSYATNSVGTGYSSERQFRPVDTPTVTGTVDVPSITDSTALLGGDITDTGGDTVTAVGIIWDTDSDPINNDNGADVPMTVADPFSQEVTGLPAGTPLWFVAYASNGAGPGYSAPVPFTTDPGAPTMNPTPTVTSVVVDGATLGGTMLSDGGGIISDCGVEWSTTSGGPYDPPQSVGVCTENVAFSTPVSGLTTGLTYYFRAYATNGQGTDYSGELSFVPQGPPVVVSSPEANVSFNSADLGGNVTNDGGSTVTQRGIVWDVNPDPELQPSKTIVPMGSGTGIFGPQTVSLPSASTIYFEAYATSAAGTAYSDDNRSFPTGTEPTAQATNANFVNIAGTSMRVTWTRGNGDGVIVVLRDTGTIAAPADNVDYAYDLDYTVAPEIPPNTQNFVVYKGAASSAWVTGLTKTTSYSVAVYEYAGSGASTDYLQTLPAEDTDITKAYASHNYDHRIDCTQCHGSHFGLIPRGEDLKNKCVTCHQPGQLAETKLEFNNHLTPQRNPAIDDVDCGMCHELHNISGTLTGNTTLSTNTITPGTDYNKSFLRANVGKYVDPNYSSNKEAWPKAFLHNDTPKREDPHPDAPQAAVTPERAVEGGDVNSSRGYCQVCHTMTAYHRNNPAAGASTPSDYSKAGSMQCHDGGTVNQACAEEVQCGDCHEHNNSFAGVNSNVPCESCHDSGQGTLPIITTQFDTVNVLSSHIPNGTPTKSDCVVCHGDHSHDGFVYGFDADDGVTKYSSTTAGHDTLATGNGEAFAPHCLSCHDSNGAASLPETGSDQTRTSPFISSNPKPPPPIDATAWSTASHNIPTPSATPMTCIGDGANGCHASGHGTKSNSLLAAWNGGVGEPATNAPESPRQFCYNCHDGTISTIDIQQQFIATAPVEITGSDYLTVNKQHDVFPADQTFSGMAEADFSCKNCHQPHVNSANDKDPTPLTGYEYLNSVANPDTGDPLPLYNPANYGGGDNVVDPKGTGWQETDTIEFCLACHDGTMPNGVTMPAGMLDMAASWAGDQHGGHSDRATTKGWLKYPFGTAPQSLPNVDADYDGTTPYSSMNCTTCHGAHGSGNIFNLRSSITVAGVQMTTGTSHGNYAYPGVPGTEYIFPIDSRSGLPEQVGWGAWCSFCHDVNHDTKTGLGCQGSHMHGGGSNGNF